MNESFKQVLAQLMDHHQSHPDDPQLYQLQGQLDNIHDTMTENIDKLVQREERIELLVNRTSHLTDGAVEFRRQAGKLRRALWWRSVRNFVYAGVVVVLLVVVASSRCGGFSLPQCRFGGSQEEEGERSNVKANSKHSDVKADDI
eukprot:GHVS01063834.1.p1 GENE.GHVS01063834.1~~GHVS01063834.1.p1  ORF type:complete len:145 (-),score=33.91 GHVS01063834.1:85-519(-)